VEGLGEGLGLGEVEGLGEVDGRVEPGEGLGEFEQSVPNKLHLYNHSTMHTITRTVKQIAPIIAYELIFNNS